MNDKRGEKVAKHASVAPKTLTKLSREELEMPRRRVRGPSEPKPIVTELRVHDAVWARALVWAEGDLRRIQILSHTKVTVHPGPWR